jgi:four helix bundle protein
LLLKISFSLHYLLVVFRIKGNIQIKSNCMKTENIVAEKSYQFALRIVKLYQYLRKNNEYELSKQVLRSGTSISSNVEEATGALSKKDFLSKISISYRETRETKLWLRLLRDSRFISELEAESLLKDCEELLRIIGSIQKTTKLHLKS